MNTTDFWAGVHRDQNRLWLTGSNPGRVLTLHDVEPGTGDRVLDHGVGMGDMQRHLGGLGCGVVSCDIVAVHGAIHPMDLADEAPFDYAISHLVAQHLTDQDLVHYADALPMKRGGVATIQLASLESGKVQDDVHGPLVFRSMEHMSVTLPEWKLAGDPKVWFWKGANIRWWIARREW